MCIRDSHYSALSRTIDSATLPSGGGVIFSTFNELWVSDGTTLGTSLLIATGHSCSDFVSMNNLIYMGCRHDTTSSTDSSSLWVTDGTTIGTNEIENFSLLGNVDTKIGGLTIVNSNIYFHLTGVDLSLIHI